MIRRSARLLTPLSSNPPSPPMVWEKRIPDWLQKIQGRVVQDVESMAALSTSDVWQHTIRSLAAVASVPSAKLIRPQLVLLGYCGGKGSEEELSKKNEGLELFAAGVELQHLFMLVHDDVMDHGTIRRGIPTVNAELLRFGLSHDVVTNAVTVLGDVVHARALALLVNGASTVRRASPPEMAPAILTSRDIVIESSYRAGLGQFQDILGWPGLQDQVSDAASSAKFIEEFLDLKGANHTFTAPLVSGLRLAGMEDHALEGVLSSWGRHAGLALQGLDDVIDLVGDPITTGKDTSQDLREGRLSLPLVMMHGLCSDAEWRDVTSMMGCVVGLAERRLWFSLIRKYHLVDRCLVWVENQLKLAETDAKNLGNRAVLSRGCSLFNSGLRSHADRVRKSLQTK